MRRSNKHINAIVDSVLFFIAIFLTLKIRSLSSLFVFSKTLQYTLTGSQILIFCSSYPIYLLNMYILGIYEEHINISVSYIISRSIIANGIILLWILLATYFFQVKIIPRSLITVFLIINFILFSLNKFLRIHHLKKNVHNIIIIGDPADKHKLFSSIKAFKTFNINILGIVTPNGKTNASDNEYTILGSYSDIDKVIIEGGVKVAFIVARNSDEKESILKNIQYSTYKKTRLYMTPNNYEILLSAPKYIRIHDIPLIQINKSAQNLFMIKRLFDLFTALILTILLTPLFLLVFFLVKTTSKGPAIFKQNRVGKNQELFTIHKFRTMYTDFEDKIYQAQGESDKRITPLGGFLRKSRLDEIPQLLNIIKGDMSFIGPRPLVEQEVKEGLDSNIWYRERFSILPGLTGLAQVHGDYYTITEEKMKYDLWYVFHYTPFMDISIFVRTLKIIFLRSGS